MSCLGLDPSTPSAAGRCPSQPHACVLAHMQHTAVQQRSNVQLTEQHVQHTVSILQHVLEPKMQLEPLGTLTCKQVVPQASVQVRFCVPGTQQKLPLLTGRHLLLRLLTANPVGHTKAKTIKESRVNNPSTTLHSNNNSNNRNTATSKTLKKPKTRAT